MSDTKNAPMVSMNVYSIDDPAFFGVSAVYFLLSENAVVYVGQSIDVYSRIRSHILDGRKVFTQVILFHVPSKYLNYVESHFIKTLRPKFNGKNTARNFWGRGYVSMKKYVKIIESRLFEHFNNTCNLEQE